MVSATQMTKCRGPNREGSLLGRARGPPLVGAASGWPRRSGRGRTREEISFLDPGDMALRA